VESFRDSGVLETRTRYQGDARLDFERFDEAGKPAEAYSYDEDGNPKTHRKLAADGTVTLDEAFYPDGSRKVNTTGPKVSAPEK